MSQTQRPQRSRSTPATSGYLGSVLVNAIIFYVINVNPGWEAAPFLTPDTAQVIGLVNASIIATAVAHLVYVVVHSRPIRALGGIVTSGSALAAAVQIWRVFPFDFTASSSDSTILTRAVLVAVIVGTIIGIIASARMLLGGPSQAGCHRASACEWRTS